MTRTEMQSRVRVLRDELETRHKYGTIKIADDSGKPISSEKLQSEMYFLTYKLSKAYG